MPDPQDLPPPRFSGVTPEPSDSDTVPLHDARRRMEAVLAATEVGTWTFNIVENKVWADGNLTRMFGVAPEEGAGGRLETFLAAIHPDDKQRVENQITTAIAKDSSFVSEYRLLHKDGSIKTVIARGAVERDANGKVLSLPGVILDISDRVHAEKERHELSKELDRRSRMVETMLSSIGDFAYIFDRDGRFVYANKPLLERWNLELQDVVGKTFLDLKYSDELAARLQGQICVVVETKQTLSDETPFTSASGVTGFYEYTFTPVLDEDGSVEFIGGYTRDITQRQATFEQLQRSEENFRTLAETLPDTVWESDPQGQMLWTNSVLPRITGLSRDEICGDGYRALVHPEDGALTLAAWDRARETGNAIEYQHRVRQADGSWRWHHVRGTAARDTRGDIFRWIGTSRDVHDQRELHAKLERSETEFRQLADTMPQIVWAAQPDGVLDYYNRRWFEFIDLSSDNAEEARWDLYIHPEDLPAAYDAWVTSLQAGTTYEIEFRVKRADGQFRWFLVRALPIRSIEGAITRWFGTCTDIHDQRELQAKLERSEAQFRQLADTIPQLAWMAQPDGEILWYNNRWHDYTGATPEQMKGDGWKTVHDPEILPEVITRWQACLQTGDPFDMTFPLKGADGKFRPFLTRVMPFRDDSGSIVLWFGTNTDVSEQKRTIAEREDLLASERAARTTAERANQMKDEFLATLSHELRSPLNAIFGWSQILRDSADDPETLTEGLDVVDRNVRMLTQLIEDLLDMSRIISGKLRMNVQQVNAVECIHSAIDTVRLAADAKGVRLEKILDSHAPPISGDPSRIQQIVWNLLSNAIKFTPRGGKVQVLLERVNSHLEISVADDGQGISAEFLPDVFDRFRQADAATNRKHGGLGLGLAIVKQLVEMHGGTIHVKSGGTNKGSTFTVHLPLKILHQPEDERSRLHPKTPTIPSAFQKNAILQGLKILIVDDERDGRELLKRVLSDCGAHVLSADSALNGLAQITEQLPDVLISDIGMPEIDGYEFLRRVRALPSDKGGKTPAIALTAFARSEDRTKALLTGFLAHLSKPVEPWELIATIGAITGRNVCPEA